MLLLILHLAAASLFLFSDDRRISSSCDLTLGERLVPVEGGLEASSFTGGLFREDLVRVLISFGGVVQESESWWDVDDDISARNEYVWRRLYSRVDC